MQSSKENGSKEKVEGNALVHAGICCSTGSQAHGKTSNG
jgi:hypothetical protein